MAITLAFQARDVGSIPIIRSIFCGYRIMAITPAFQASDDGSIPFTRSKFYSTVL